VQARLDEETQAALDRVVQRRRMKPSEIVREGIRLVDEKYKSSVFPRLIGVGMYSSGKGDLATNKKYMEGFGAKGLKRGPRK